MYCSQFWRLRSPSQSSDKFVVCWKLVCWSTASCLLFMSSRGGREGRSPLGPLLYFIIPFTRAPVSWPNNLPKTPHVLILSHWGLGFQLTNWPRVGEADWGRHEHSVCGTIKTFCKVIWRHRHKFHHRTHRAERSLQKWRCLSPNSKKE